MENNLQIIQYDGKIAIMDGKVTNINNKDFLLWYIYKNHVFNTNNAKITQCYKKTDDNHYIKVSACSQLFPISNFRKLIAHSPHIDGVADIVIESEVKKLAEDWVYNILDTINKDNKYPLKPLNIGFIAGYTQAKQNRYTEEQVRNLLEITITATISNIGDKVFDLSFKEKRDKYIEEVIQQLTQKQYELVRIDEQGNYVIKEK